MMQVRPLAGGHDRQRFDCDAEAGGIGLFVDALDAQAAGYYLNFGFTASPDNPLLLFLSAKLAG